MALTVSSTSGLRASGQLPSSRWRTLGRLTGADSHDLPRVEPVVGPVGQENSVGHRQQRWLEQHVIDEASAPGREPGEALGCPAVKVLPFRVGVLRAGTRRLVSAAQLIEDLIDRRHRDQIGHDDTTIALQGINQHLGRDQGIERL